MGMHACWDTCEGGLHTRDNIARIHGVFVLDEAEAIHELDLGNLAGAMGVEVVLNIGLGSYSHGPVSDARSPSKPQPSKPAPAPDPPENAQQRMRE